LDVLLGSLGAGPWYKLKGAAEKGKPD